jgi:murein DD-endopeptidase MepM/ murein hydrolase activator NlpD
VLVLLFLITRCVGQPPTEPATPSPEASAQAAELPKDPTLAVASTADEKADMADEGTPTPTRAISGLPDSGAVPESNPVPQVYNVRGGDTLGSIASRFGCDLDDLIAENEIDDPNRLLVGQTLELSSCQIESGPSTWLLPNSEFVNSPAYVGFDVEAFAREQGGYLAKHTEQIKGKDRSGPEIVELVAQHYSVGPRMLLAVLEVKSGWVTNPSPTGAARDFPMGYKGGGWELLYWQLAWAADELNKGYYDWRGRGMTPISWRDTTATNYSPSLNAATAGLQRFLSKNTNKKQWKNWVGDGPEGFSATYRRLFGDPEQYAIEPLIPAGTTQPYLTLPWSMDEMWYYTSGPHGAWEEGSAWAALDFVPPERGLGCQVAKSWATAAASGLVIRSQFGEVMIDLDGDGYEQTGWVLFYLHLASKDRVEVGTRVKQGDPIGHPSCEGGISDATHLHFARKYNGEWIAADGPLPLVLSGWQAHSSGTSYDGTLTSGDQVRTACQCWKKKINGIKAIE